jgi:hypothetical protein
MLTLATMRVSGLAPFVSAALLSLAGCQDPDVGQLCKFDLEGIVDAQGNVVPSVAVDFLETGKPECENLVCMVSPSPAASTAPNKPYCSKACVSNSDCSQDQTGLECRKVILDETFLNSLDPTVKQKYLPGSTFTNYCARPLQ